MSIQPRNPQENHLHRVMFFFSTTKEDQALAITNTDPKDLTPSKLTFSRGLKQTTRDGTNLFVHGKEAKIRLNFANITKVVFGPGKISNTLSVTTKKGTITFTKVPA